MFDANLYSEVYQEECNKLKETGIKDPIRDVPDILRERMRESFNERTTGRKL